VQELFELRDFQGLRSIAGVLVERFGLIICSRTDSSRLPCKPFLPINGRSLIDYLVGNCVDTGIQTVLAVPEEQVSYYREHIKQKTGLTIMGGVKGDPLQRMYDCAKEKGFDHVIRVCHDKIFIDHRQVREFINRYLDKELDYIYSTNFIDGMSFEIFSISALGRAQREFKNVEHISFAIDAVTKRKENYQHFTRSKSWLDRRWPNSGLRLLVDHPTDYQNLLEVVKPLKGQINIDVLMRTIDRKAVRKNSLPFMTFYTCSYNDWEYLHTAIESVISQTFCDFEYLLVDDGSTDERVSAVMNKYAARDKRIRIIRNPTNIGLSSSSNLAVQQAHGKYIMRIDADDFLINKLVLADFLQKADECNADIIYPDFMRDGKLQQGSDHHHVGGTLFRKRALDYLKFTDGLRHFDSRDIFERAKNLRIKTDYFPVATFFYRNRKGSLSNKMTKERKEVLKKIKSGKSGEHLL